MFDVFLFYQLNSIAFRFLWLDAIVIFFAVYAPYILAGVLFLLLLKDFKKHIFPVIDGAISGALGGLLVLIANLVFYRARPFVLISPSLLSRSFVNSSFPSFHATVLFALSFSLFLYGIKNKEKLWKTTGELFLFVSFLVSLARVFTGLHWLFDIIAGALLGLIITFLVRIIFGKLLTSSQKEI